MRHQARACPRNKASGLLMRRITGSNFVRCAAMADRLGDASRPHACCKSKVWGTRLINPADSNQQHRAPRLLQSSTFHPSLPSGPNAQRRRNSELARPIRRDAVTWAGPVVVDDLPQEIPITRRELDVIETYLGALLDEALGAPE